MDFMEVPNYGELEIAQQCPERGSMPRTRSAKDAGHMRGASAGLC